MGKKYIQLFYFYSELLFWERVLLPYWYDRLSAQVE